MTTSKKILKTTVLTLALSSITLYAADDHSAEANSHKDHDHAAHEQHEGHSHGYESLKNEVSKETVEKAAKQKVRELVKEKKIHSSWASVPISKIGKTHYGDTDDWVVGFDNRNMKNEKKRTLYIFVSTRGEIRGANYTGK